MKEPFINKIRLYFDDLFYIDGSQLILKRDLIISDIQYMSGDSVNDIKLGFISNPQVYYYVIALHRKGDILDHWLPVR